MVASQPPGCGDMIFCGARVYQLHSISLFTTLSSCCFVMTLSRHFRIDIEGGHAPGLPEEAPRFHPGGHLEGCQVSHHTQDSAHSCSISPPLTTCHRRPCILFSISHPFIDSHRCRKSEATVYSSWYAFCRVVWRLFRSQVARKSEEMKAERICVLASPPTTGKQWLCVV